MVIAVKYCGGCNCSYDRATLVTGLQHEFPGINIVNAENPGGVDPDLVLVVCGCSSVCAAHKHLEGKQGKAILACEQDFAAVRASIQEFLQS